MEAIQLREQVLLEVKEKVAEISLKVIPAPEQNVLKLRSLIVLLNQGDQDERLRCAYFSVQKLVAYSLTELFKTILPDYEIEGGGEGRRGEEGEEDGVPTKKRLNKEDYQLVRYERELLIMYKLFVDQLERMSLLGSKRAKDFKSDLLSCAVIRCNLSRVAVECICQLISSKPAFNLTERLVRITTRVMISSKSVEVQQAGCEAFETLFRQDTSGEISWLIVRELTKLIKSAGISTEPRVLYTFLSLNIRELPDEREKGKSNKNNIEEIRNRLKQMSRKQRKHNKEMQKLKKDLIKNDIEENTSKVATIHTQILSQIFSIYFRVLKSAILEIDNPSKFCNFSKILDAVLAGLAQFAHLINMNFFEDVFNLLHKLLLSDALTGKQNFHCLITIFTILGGQGEVLTVDPQRFYAQFYRELLNLSCQADDKDVEMILRCVHVMLIRRKKNLTTNRMLGFIKRFATLTLTNSTPTTMAFLSIVRYMLINFAKADILLDNENSGCGLFRSDTEDPEFCNASSTQLYEMHLARRHVDTQVARFANHILSLSRDGQQTATKNVPYEELRMTPIEMFRRSIECGQEICLPTQEKLIISRKRRFHGFVLDAKSLTQTAIQEQGLESFL